MAADDLDDVDAREQFLQETGRDHPPSLVSGAEPLRSRRRAGASANMPL